MNIFRHRAAFGLGFLLFCTSIVSGYLLHQVELHCHKNHIRSDDDFVCFDIQFLPQDDLAAWVSWLRYPSPQYWASHPILERELAPVIIMINEY